MPRNRSQTFKKKTEQQQKFLEVFWSVATSVETGEKKKKKTEQEQKEEEKEKEDEECRCGHYETVPLIIPEKVGSHICSFSTSVPARRA